MNDEDDLPPLSDEDIAELQRRVEDADDPRRYMILSQLGSFRLWHQLSSDSWCNTQSSGTLYKREMHAKAVLLSMDKGKDVGIVPVIVDEDDNILETGELK